jgi:DNA helicase-2/ATP-dependent DNA helicase PcrA
VINENQDAFFDHVSKKTGLVQELKKDATPEGWLKFKNIEELLGIKDFTEGQKKLTEHEVLYLNLWKMWHWQQIYKDTSDEDRVALMTIHLAKGLEFHMFSWWEWKKICSAP